MNKTNKVMLISFFVNLLLSLTKLILGVIAKSKALIADGIHSFSDLSTDIISLIGNKMALKKPDFEHPYGHGKIEYLTSIIIGLIILILGFSLIYNSFSDNSFSIASIVLFTSLLTIICKFLLSRYIIFYGKKYNNSILIASGKESSMDVISSIVVLLSSIFTYFIRYVSWFSYADMLASIIVGIFIIKTGYQILSENISTIIDEQVTDDVYISKLEKIILSSKLVKKIDSLIIIKLGHNYKLTCELSMDGDLSINISHNELIDIERKIKNFDKKIQYINIHINPYNN